MIEIARMAKLVYAHDSKSCSNECRFESDSGHQKKNCEWSVIFPDVLIHNNCGEYLHQISPQIYEPPGSSRYWTNGNQ